MSFVVKIFKQDISFEVHEKESILEAALKQGINLPYGCRNGECGSCIAEIKSGSFFYDNGNPIHYSQTNSLSSSNKALSILGAVSALPRSLVNGV